MFLDVPIVRYKTGDLFIVLVVYTIPVIYYMIFL